MGAKVVYRFIGSRLGCRLCVLMTSLRSGTGSMWGTCSPSIGMLAIVRGGADTSRCSKAMLHSMPMLS